MKPRILLVGSSHYHELFYENEPSKEFLKKLDKLRNSLITYNATKICVEIDENQNGITDTVNWAKIHDNEFIERLNHLQSSHNNEDIYEVTLELNKPENIKFHEEIYGHMMLLGDNWNTSIPWLTSWYKRNMIMVNNITREIDNDSRVIMIVGAGHLYILKQLLESSGKFEVETFYEWEMNR
ncbi:DUF5694 domain-containing protein [Jeotgalicoccus sp. ATCC 8456]|uniref:DUF5694 domain-containing protein n=1 Tax=Jeotgalicoccus sp. ATCC 8456 TaxID=946435 RepID=UPI0018E5E2DB|nr:DUF5694 domain-containing protein [Jeotgalicoccus sp. ATCC 8456]QQD84118.1 hypothetical protein JEM45_05470 [Jeotgalicoccus sp. ATCC 8456]